MYIIMYMFAIVIMYKIYAVLLCIMYKFNKGGNMGEFDKNKYKNEFAKEKYDRIIVIVPKGDRSVIDSYRKNKGYSSLNAYINDLIRKDMSEGEKSGVHIDTINNADGTINIG